MVKLGEYLAVISDFMLGNSEKEICGTVQQMFADV